MRCLIVSEAESSKDIKQRYMSGMNEFRTIARASNINQAVQKLKKYSYDLIILDVSSPKNANMSLLKWIRTAKINIGVIFISDENNADIVREAFGYGVCDYIIKPYTAKRFREAVIRAVGRRTFLSQFKVMTQAEIDHFIALTVLTATELFKSKGISTETLSNIKQALEDEDEGFTATQISDKTGLSRITVRRYLEEMVEGGLLQTDLEYGEIGRPQKVYMKTNIPKGE
jgi:two-component system CitB family response regulator